MEHILPQIYIQSIENLNGFLLFSAFFCFALLLTLQSESVFTVTFYPLFDLTVIGNEFHCLTTSRASECALFCYA